MLTACSWATSKWAHLAPPGGPMLLRASAGRHGDERAFDLDDDDLAAALLADLDRTMNLRAEPVAVRVSRWPRSFPQYAPGHLERVDAVEAALRRDTPALVVTGAAFRGLGVPACIHQGRQAGAALGGHRPVVYNS
jgi:oxygen-dependent protoporphyrinogen oxidase